eukprot:269200-Chlamydomonas_euryale.AAC.1
MTTRKPVRLCWGLCAGAPAAARAAPGSSLCWQAAQTTRCRCPPCSGSPAGSEEVWARRGRHERDPRRWGRKGDVTSGIRGGGGEKGTSRAGSEE